MDNRKLKLTVFAGGRKHRAKYVASLKSTMGCESAIVHYLRFILYLSPNVSKISEKISEICGSFVFSGNEVWTHPAEFLRPLKRPGEAVGVVVLNQVGVRLFAVVAHPQLDHVVIPLVEALRGRKRINSTHGCSALFLKCAHIKRNLLGFFFLSVLPPGRKICSGLNIRSQRQR